MHAGKRSRELVGVRTGARSIRHAHCTPHDAARLHLAFYHTRIYCCEKCRSARFIRRRPSTHPIKSLRNHFHRLFDAPRVIITLAAHSSVHRAGSQNRGKNAMLSSIRYELPGVYASTRRPAPAHRYGRREVAPDNETFNIFDLARGRRAGGTRYNAILWSWKNYKSTACIWQREKFTLNRLFFLRFIHFGVWRSLHFSAENWKSGNPFRWTTKNMHLYSPTCALSFTIRIILQPFVLYSELQFPLFRWLAEYREGRQWDWICFKLTYVQFRI